MGFDLRSRNPNPTLVTIRPWTIKWISQISIFNIRYWQLEVYTLWQKRFCFYDKFPQFFATWMLESAGEHDLFSTEREMTLNLRSCSPIQYCLWIIQFNHNLKHLTPVCFHVAKIFQNLIIPFDLVKARLARRTSWFDIQTACERFDTGWNR